MRLTVLINLYDRSCKFHISKWIYRGSCKLVEKHWAGIRRLLFNSWLCPFLWVWFWLSHLTLNKPLTLFVSLYRRHTFLPWKALNKRQRACVLPQSSLLPVKERGNAKAFLPLLQAPVQSSHPPWRVFAMPQSSVTSLSSKFTSSVGVFMWYLLLCRISLRIRISS